MAYVEWHGTVPNHFKTKHLMKLLGCRKAEAVGYIACLSAWAIENRPGGVFKRSLIEIGAEWEGEDGRLAAAMLEAGWVDDIGGGQVSIHDWHEVTSGYRKARADTERARVRREEEKARESRESRADVAPETRESRAAHAPRGTNERNERNERTEREEGGGGADVPPAPPPASSGGNQGQGMGAELQGILHRNGVGLEEADRRPPSPRASTLHLIGVARSVTKMPNRTETLATHLEAAAARFGAAVVEQWLYDPTNQGASVIVLADALERKKAKADKLF